MVASRRPGIRRRGRAARAAPRAGDHDLPRRQLRRQFAVDAAAREREAAVGRARARLLAQIGVLTARHRVTINVRSPGTDIALESFVVLARELPIARDLAYCDAIEAGIAGTFNVADDEPAAAREWMPAFAAAYAAMYGVPSLPTIDATLTMRPELSLYRTHLNTLILKPQKPF